MRLDQVETPHLLCELGELLFEPRGLRDKRLRRLLPVGNIQLAQITRDALLKLRSAAFHLGPREVPIAIIHRLELAAVDRNARIHKQAHLPAEFDKARAHLANRTAVILPEIGNGFVVGDKPTKEPHQLDIAAGLALEPPARLHPVEIAIDIELQQADG